MTDKKAVIFDVQRNSCVDGPGIRTTIFFKGCNLSCAWCHNPEGQGQKPELMFYENRCSGCNKCNEVCPFSLKKCDDCGRCALVCPTGARVIVGKECTVDEVIRVAKKDIRFYESSGGGVTFSGGECMLRIDFLNEALMKCKAFGIHTAVDTAGDIPFEYFERILPYTDLFLYDIKTIDNEKHKKYTGVGNKLILKNLERLIRSGARVWVRIPIIPTVNDSIEEMRAIRERLIEYGYPEKVELLPYHAMGAHKYHALGMHPCNFSVPDEDSIKRLKSVFK